MKTIDYLSYVSVGVLYREEVMQASSGLYRSYEIGGVEVEH